MSSFNYENGELKIEDINLSEIAKKIKTPFYCYSYNHLKEQYSKLDQSINLADYHICYSIKSNSNQSIIKTFSKLGSGADVVSMGELKRALKAGIPSQKIVFSGIGKSSEEIEFAIKNNILMFNVESIGELKKLSNESSKLNIESQVALRINPDISAGANEKISTGKAQDKFGIDWKNAVESYELASKLPGIKIIGIDVHIGSQINDIEPFRKSFDLLVEIIEILRAKGHQINVLDVGGGLGVKYHPNEIPLNVNDYGALLSEKLGGLGCKIIIEPGRLLTANSAVLITKTLYIKNTESNNFIIVDAAMNDFIRPTLYGAYHEIIPIKENKENNLLDYDIVGPVCESGDFFGKKIKLGKIDEDDLMAIKSVGAYGSVLSSNYNTRASINEILVNNKNFEIIRNRIEDDEIINRDKIPDWV
ncbi:diaminopimelate decarboxylase [Hyphomicrobiales bacterium]|nr:diaminopimelate decarboxylase [Hyphomicrobiales bacterium]